MADADAIARQALEFASDYLHENQAKIIEMSGGDLELLHQAARIVQSRGQSHTKASLSPEHLAFTLITAAYESLREEPKA
jgi:hypothetical protein